MLLLPSLLPFLCPLFLPIPTKNQKVTTLISYWLIFPVLFLLHKWPDMFSFIPFFLIWSVSYYRYSFCTLLFFVFCLTIYPGNPSISVCRDFPYSCLQLHIMQYSTVWMYCSFFNYCPIYGHLDCLQNSAITMLQWIILWTCIFILLEIYHQARFPEMELLGQKVHAYVVFLDMAKFFSRKVISVCLPISNIWECLFPHSLAKRMCCHTLKFSPTW